MAADGQKGTLLSRFLTLIAIVLLLGSLAAVLVGSMTTLFAYSPANTADAGVLIRSGPAMLLGGVFGLAKARRIWRLSRSRGPNGFRPRPTSWPVEVVWLAGLLAFAVVTTRFLLEASALSMVPVTLYGSHVVAHVLPLTFFARVLGSLIGIRLVPTVAAVAIARRIVPPTLVAAIGGLAALAATTLACVDSRQFPAMPYVFTLFILDLALAITFVSVALESLSAERT
ncbi:MAG TPA: hypothetical protein VM686_23560 [Polyangiaceae bacterium]|nr:hypothetical protein [Polyangiaceae bacterium]